MLSYNRRLKTKGRWLRSNPTDAELHLWYRLRRKEILGVQFYRQKPIGNYIADFMRRQQDWWSNWTALTIWSSDKRHTTQNGPAGATRIKSLAF